MEFTAIRSPAAGRTSEHDGGGPSSTTDQAQVEKEHMFDKVVTPSDVGKLNRLVIPKQHAEKYFPLDSTTAAASSTGGGGGLLLSFEDRTGKPWRFRYSYWNSSQSYVMTKGWSRFVKEKRLDAGDTVSFGRGVGSEAAKGRLFIDWRRRPDNNPLPPHALGLGRFTTLPNSLPFAPWTMTTTAAQQGRHHPFVSGSGGRAPFMQQQPTPPSFVCDYDHGYYGAPGHGGGRQVLYYRPQQQQHAAVVLESVPVRMGMAMAAEEAVPSSGTKRVRLFGVNLDYSEEDSNSRPAPAPMQLQQLMSPASSTSTSSSSGKARCSLNLDL